MGYFSARRGRGMTSTIVAASATLLGASSALAQSDDGPRIFNPGAPGEPTVELTATDSVALGETAFTEADVRFMQHMIVHHGQAVEMVAMIPDRSVTRDVQLMGERISSSQAFEIEMMKRWLRVRKQPLDDPDLHHGHHGHHGDHGGDGGKMAMEDDKDGSGMAMGDGMKDMMSKDMAEDKGGLSDTPLMMGMLSPKQMHELEMSDGLKFDVLFLEGMIRHHQGAIDMVDMLMMNEGSGLEPELSSFLTSVVSDQSAEIIRMRYILTQITQ